LVRYKTVSSVAVPSAILPTTALNSAGIFEKSRAALRFCRGNVVVDWVLIVVDRILVVFGDGYEAAPCPDNPTQGHGAILLLEGRRRTDAFYIGQRSAEKRRRSKGEDPMLEIEAATYNRRIAQGVVDWSGSPQPSGRNLGLPAPKT
jgi:hypothetical protein